jgi:cation diffusion facilitator family transporter
MPSLPENSPARINIRLQRWVAVLAIALFVVKSAAYFITNSVAVLTDALESIVNVLAGLMGLYSLTLSAKPRDSDHPYGHGKAEFISAGVEGTLIVISGLLILFEAVRNLIHPEPISSIDKGMLLISVTAVLNFLMGHYAVITGKRHQSLALVASGKHLKSDTYSTLGILLGLAVVYFTRIEWIDRAVALGFAVYIIYYGYGILRQALAGIMDESDRELIARVVEVLNANRTENWIDLHNLRVIKYGSVLHLDAHLTVPWYMRVSDAHQEIESMMRLLRDHFGESLELFVHSDHCMDFSCRLCSKKECPVRKADFERRLEWNIENVSKDTRHRLL